MPLPCEFQLKIYLFARQSFCAEFSKEGDFKYRNAQIQNDRQMQEEPVGERGREMAVAMATATAMGMGMNKFPSC